MNDIEKDFLELRLSEQAILGESLAEKNARVKELEAEVRYLKGVLESLVSATRLQPRAAEQPYRNRVPVPRRWKA